MPTTDTMAQSADATQAVAPTTWRQRDPWGGERAGFLAQGVIARRDSRLTWNQPLPGAGLLLGNDVRISIELDAVLAA